jgi:hypothetical protein
MGRGCNVIGKLRRLVFEAAGNIGVRIDLTLRVEHGPASGKLAEGVAERLPHQPPCFNFTTMAIYFREMKVVISTEASYYHLPTTVPPHSALIFPPIGLSESSHMPADSVLTALSIHRPSQSSFVPDPTGG